MTEGLRRKLSLLWGVKEEKGRFRKKHLTSGGTNSSGLLKLCAWTSPFSCKSETNFPKTSLIGCEELTKMKKKKEKYRKSSS